MDRMYEEMINRKELRCAEGYLEKSAEGELLFCGHNARELAEEYGTPLMAFSESRLRENYRRMRSAFEKCYPKIQICFACKSNHLLGVISVLKGEGAYADVVSGGEFYKAEKAGTDPEHIVMNGNNKSDAEILMGIRKGAMINVDSLSELERVASAAESEGKKARICIRVNPDVTADSIAEFLTGLKKSKFGVDMDNGDALRAFRRARDASCLAVEGIHCHIGSQIENREFYRQAVEKVMDLCGTLKRELGLELSYVNMGGGFAIPFEYLDQVDRAEDFAELVTGVIKKKICEHGLKPPVLMIEPGGSLVGNTAITLCRVGRIKQKEEKRLAALDAGGDLLLRATQGWYTYRAVCANKLGETGDMLYDLVGPLCYEGDIPARDRMLPELEEGDLIAFLDTGAYVTTLMNQYNGRLLPAVLMITEEGGIKLIRRRDSYEDLIRNEMV